MENRASLAKREVGGMRVTSYRKPLCKQRRIQNSFQSRVYDIVSRQVFACIGRRRYYSIFIRIELIENTMFTSKKTTRRTKFLIDSIDSTGFHYIMKVNVVKKSLFFSPMNIKGVILIFL